MPPQTTKSGRLSAAKCLVAAPCVGRMRLRRKHSSPPTQRTPTTRTSAQATTRARVAPDQSEVHKRTSVQASSPIVTRRRTSVLPGRPCCEWWHALVVHKRTSSRVTKCSLADDVSRETRWPVQFTTIQQLCVAPDQRMRELLDISSAARSSLLELTVTAVTNEGTDNDKFQSVCGVLAPRQAWRQVDPVAWLG